MALTVNGFRTGRAGVTDLADIREYIAIEQEAERKRVKALTMELAEFIAAQLGDKYHAWLESTPDGNAEFLAACQAKVAELQAQPSPIDEAQEIERGIDEQIDSEPVKNDEYNIPIDLIERHNAMVKPLTFSHDQNCKHEKAFPTYGGMMCRCGAKFEARNEFEQRLVNSRNPRGNGYVNWQLR